MKDTGYRDIRRRRGAVTVVVLAALLLSVDGRALAQELSVEPRNTASLEALIAAGESGEDYVLIDVRTPREYADGHLPTAINIDHREIADGLAEMDRDQPIVLYCRSGNRSRRADRTLRRMGFTNVVDFGGIIHWDGRVTTDSE